MTNTKQGLNFHPQISQRLGAAGLLGPQARGYPTLPPGENPPQGPGLPAHLPQDSLVSGFIAHRASLPLGDERSKNIAFSTHGLLIWKPYLSIYRLLMFFKEGN